MNKQALIKKIVAQLSTELDGYHKAARIAHADATHEQNKPENKYDTRGLEASYLAHGQARQMMEMEAAIAVFENMDAREFDPQEPIAIGAIVELEHEGEHTFYFIATRAGGMEIIHEKQEVLVITPQSPLGSELHGKKQNDLIHLPLAGKKKKYRIVKVA